MISLEKVGNAIKFTFNGNDHYLQDGTIEVPLNSLMLVTDESDMFTLKKSATNDIFVSGLYSEIGMSKSQLESWFKENAVGGAGGTDEEKVQEMIDASISGKADVSALNVYADSVKYNPTTKYVEFYHNGTGGTKVFQYDASAFVIDGMVENVEIKNGNLVITFNTDAGKQNISIPITEIFDANNYYNKAEIDSKLNGKINKSAIVTSITSTSTNYQVASAKAIYNNITINDVDWVELPVVKNTDLTGYNGQKAFRVHIKKPCYGNVSFALSNYIAITVNGYGETIQFDNSQPNPTYTVVGDEFVAEWIWPQTEDWSGVTCNVTDYGSYLTKIEVGNASTELVKDIVEEHIADTTIHVTAAEKTTWNNKSNFSGNYNDLTNKPTIPTVPSNVSAFNNDAGYITSGYVYNKAEIDVKERVTSTALNDLEQRKLDASAYTPTDLSNYYNKTQVDNKLGGKQKTLVSGTNISIATGETADTINCTLPFEKNNTNSVTLGGYNNTNRGTYCYIGGQYNVINNYGSQHYIIGDYNQIGLSTSDPNFYTTLTVGEYIINRGGVVFGKYNSYSNTTLFSVGNGTGNTGRHNAFEIRQNGDIYITLNGQDVKLQDQLGGGSLGGYVTTDTEQIISGRKTFINTDKAIVFKQTLDTSKVGFSIKNSAAINNEVASFEFRPNTFTIDDVKHPLLYFGHYRSTNIANAGVPQTVIGFRQYDEKNAAAYHYLMPLPEKAKTPFSLTTSFKDYYAPMGFKNGSTMITADNTGVVDLSSELGGLKFVKLTQSEYDGLATKDGNTVYFIVPTPPVPKVTAKYNITDTTNPTLILYYDTFGITSMIVDGGTSESVTGDSYQFSTTGEHTVEFILSGSTVPQNMFGNGYSDIPLTSVAFSDAITSMGNVFAGCENITNIDWGNGVASLTMEGNFKNCRGLTSIVFPEQLVNFSAGDEVYDTYSDSNITSVTFSNRLTTFDTVWTMNPSRDFEVHLGSNITKVIFDTDGSSLPTKFYIEATTPPITELSEGISISGGFALYVPASAVSAYQADGNWSNLASSINAIPTA